MAQQTLDESETVTAEFSDGTRLVDTGDGGGAVIEQFGSEDAADGIEHWRVDYDQWKDARLHAALWLRVDGFARPERGSLSFVPTNVVADGKAAVAAWLYLSGGNGHPVAREVVSDRLGVTDHTVSRYLSRVRDEIPLSD